MQVSKQIDEAIEALSEKDLVKTADSILSDDQYRPNNYTEMAINIVCRFQQSEIKLSAKERNALMILLKKQHKLWY